MRFAFRGGTRKKLCVLDNTAYCIKNNSNMKGNSLRSVKLAVKDFLENFVFKVGSKILCQVIVLPMESDPAPLFPS